MQRDCAAAAAASNATAVQWRLTPLNLSDTVCCHATSCVTDGRLWFLVLDSSRLPCLNILRCLAGLQAQPKHLGSFLLSGPVLAGLTEAYLIAPASMHAHTLCARLLACRRSPSTWAPSC
jgi:hypothetical protein